jgi:hypothetical protein
LNGRNRWLEWGRALSERRARVVDRSDLLSLALARQLPLRSLVSRHWLVSANWFRPQVSLAIQPLLWQTVWLDQSRLLPVPERVERPLTAPTGAQRVAGWPVANQAVFFQFSSALEKWSRERVFVSGLDGASPSAERAGASPGALFERVARPTQTPLQLVFRRLVEAGEFMRLKSRETATETGAHSLIERIARRSQRVEELGARAATPTQTLMVTRRPAAVTIAAAVEQAATEFRAEPVVHTAQWGSNAAPPATINLEQITDQVMRQLDRRVIAARERMGRV